MKCVTTSACCALRKIETERLRRFVLRSPFSPTRSNGRPITQRQSRSIRPRRVARCASIEIERLRRFVLRSPLFVRTVSPYSNDNQGQIVLAVIAEAVGVSGRASGENTRPDLPRLAVDCQRTGTADDEIDFLLPLVAMDRDGASGRDGDILHVAPRPLELLVEKSRPEEDGPCSA